MRSTSAESVAAAVACTRPQPSRKFYAPMRPLRPHRGLKNILEYPVHGLRVAGGVELSARRLRDLRELACGNIATDTHDVHPHLRARCSQLGLQPLDGELVLVLTGQHHDPAARWPPSRR